LFLEFEMSNARPWILAETNWKSVREAAFEVAVLPWGATEAHNFHLPYATDTFQCDYVAAESCRVAWEVGARCVALPTVPFGVQTGQARIPGCINMNPSTQLAVLRDIVASLQAQNIRKLVVLNGHGWQRLQANAARVGAAIRRVLCQIFWPAAVPQAEYFSDWATTPARWKPAPCCTSRRTSFARWKKPVMVVSTHSRSRLCASVGRGRSAIGNEPATTPESETRARRAWKRAASTWRRQRGASAAF
jgi:hypothetical protein